MAGDWIPMRLDLATDPAVIQIAAKLGLDEYAVVGRLHAFWSWCSMHLVDGHASGVTVHWIDRYLATPGFAAALAEAGWLRLRSGSSFEIPGYDHWMSSSAKRRLKDTQTKQERRASAERPQNVRKMSARDADKNRTREEERREEKNTRDPPNPPSGGNRPKTRGDPASVPIPASIDTPEVRAAWAEWIAERAARRKPLTERAARLALDQLADGLTPDQVVECIRLSIASGWQGLFPERFRGGAGTGRCPAPTKAQAQDAFLARMMADCLPSKVRDE